MHLLMISRPLDVGLHSPYILKYTCPPDPDVVVFDEQEGNKHHSVFRNFDAVFQPSSTQVQMYQSIVQPMISDILDGYYFTIIACGQTGSGSTFTMEGEIPNGPLPWDAGFRINLPVRKFFWTPDKDLHYCNNITYRM
ncbi:125 kDa kinesin-related protein [Zootermopsis nevadensis]|uniref:125 kDa kinesin-related protein n=1 Tax=Zootermopsis nevadensis TaxID=136037 RepID=A0A067QGN9_ZOONE|nr:125 kDa kinesin-related protein [Zootermopsis nevadensis]